MRTLLLCTALACVWLDGCALMLLPERCKAEREYKAGDGRISASGRVVDESGRPLRDVRMEVHTQWTEVVAAGEFEYYRAEYPHKSSEQIISERFDISRGSVLSLNLDFSKPGYESAHFYFGHDGPTEEMAKLLKGAKTTEGKDWTGHPCLDAREITVVMRRRPPSVQ